MNVGVQYYDHCTQQHCRQKLTQEEIQSRYVSLVPARHFKMVRYYGFLANRMLPKVYQACGKNRRDRDSRC
nr:transposase [Serratia ficaria]